VNLSYPGWRLRVRHFYGLILKSPCVIGLLLVALSSSSGADDKTLGVSPWTSGQLLQAWMAPVLSQVEQGTGDDYHFESASSLNEYLVKAAQGEFDLVMIPMHMGLFLIEYFDFKPLVFVRSDVNVMLVTHAGTDYHQLSDLNGATISMSDPIAITGFLTEDLLDGANLVYEKRYSGHHWKLTDGLVKRAISVAPIVSNHYEQRSNTASKKLRVLHRFPQHLDGIMVLPSSAKPADVKRMQAVLSAFKPAPTSMIKGMDSVTREELKIWRAWMSQYFPRMKQRLLELHPDFAKKARWAQPE